MKKKVIYIFSTVSTILIGCSSSKNIVTYTESEKVDMYSDYSLSVNNNKDQENGNQSFLTINETNNYQNIAINTTNNHQDNNSNNIPLLDMSEFSVDTKKTESNTNFTKQKSNNIITFKTTKQSYPINNSISNLESELNFTISADNHLKIEEIVLTHLRAKSRNNLKQIESINEFKYTYSKIKFLDIALFFLFILVLISVVQFMIKKRI